MCFAFSAKLTLFAPSFLRLLSRSQGSPDLDTCQDCDRSLMSLFGTSMSAAIAAGSAALVRQYFTEGWYPRGMPTPADGFAPSAALMKSILISSAVPDTVETSLPEDHFSELNPASAVPIPDQTGPTPKSGYGRIQLDRVLKFAAGEKEGEQESAVDLWLTDQKPISSGEFHAYCFQVTAPRAGTTSIAYQEGPFPHLPFRATLVWSDPPSALSTTWLLLNNLDLSISNVATGDVYIGNQHTGDASPVYDSTNNVEQVSLLPTDETHPGDLFSVHVRGTSISSGPAQNYSLVVSGHFRAMPVQACAGGVVCPKHCGKNGVCGEQGVCECQTGYAGVACEQTSVALPLCESTASSVPFGKFTYFHIDVPSDSASDAAPSAYRIRMRALTGEPDLYVAHDRLPTLQQFDYSPLLSVVNQPPAASSSPFDAAHLLTEVHIPIARAGRYYIGVYGYCCEAISQFAIDATQCPPASVASNAMADCECAQGA
jgi:hypothetical protein